ncbi:hypothetical protein FOA52_008777 [Chlamydomonas sp. UWO 241]|nr:hypothetical protein FOA52_008777 [Chlamydomonas sp. UWO 241]
MAEVSQNMRVGTMRGSMTTNPLLNKPELGEVKKTTFSHPPPDHTFGYKAPHDSEGAREITMKWKEHASSPSNLTSTAGKPNLDFTAMNKLSAMSGLTRAHEQGDFRTMHPVTIKLADKTARPGPGLPSDANPAHTYGMSSAHRSAEVRRVKGAYDPPMKHVIQGAYTNEWVDATLAKESAAPKRTYVPPVPTRAAIGHAIGAQQKYLRVPEGGEEWKMSKFRTVPSKVQTYIGKPYGTTTDA